MASLSQMCRVCPCSTGIVDVDATWVGAGIPEVRSSPYSLLGGLQSSVQTTGWSCIFKASQILKLQITSTPQLKSILWDEGRPGSWHTCLPFPRSWSTEIRGQTRPRTSKCYNDDHLWERDKSEQGKGLSRTGTHWIAH